MDAGVIRQRTARAGAGGARRARGPAGLALAVGAVASVVAEAVVARAWSNPGYSYVQDKIAYLGSPYCGRYNDQAVCSPQWRLMLVAWLVQGLLVLAAGLVLGRAIGGRAGVAVAATAVAEGIGFALFSLFHDSPTARENGTITWYFIGAFLVVVTGNLLALLCGLFFRRLQIPRWVGLVSMILGGVGLVAVVATLGWMPLGLAERISVYSFLLWQLLFGLALVPRGAGSLTPTSP